MKQSSEISNRKSNHISINLQEDVKSSNTTGLEKFRLLHSALPELNFQEIDPSTVIFRKNLRFPLLISSMTGGTKKSADLNRIFAECAEKNKVAIGVGSQRIGIEDENKMPSFQIRKYAPTTLVFANLGAVQLNYGYSINECKRAVDAIQADALILHLNPLQEVLMDKGNTNFSNLLKKIENICKNISVPVIIKEVGWGINDQIAKRLYSIGVSAIDVAGAGGTSWSEVEKYRSKDPLHKLIASEFRDWGIPTAEAIKAIKSNESGKVIIASGGLSNGVEMLKCIALGANLCGIARPFLKAANKSQNDLDSFIQLLEKEFRIAMFAVGAGSIEKISGKHIVRI